MDTTTKHSIILNHVRPMLSEYGLDKKPTIVMRHYSGVSVRADWKLFSQEKFADILSQELGAKGYDVDVYSEGDTVIIDDREVED